MSAADVRLDTSANAVNSLTPCYVFPFTGDHHHWLSANATICSKISVEPLTEPL